MKVKYGEQNMDIRYEVHNLESRNLPIIFHCDVANRSQPMSANWHDNIEILYCTAGSGKVVCNSVEAYMEKGDMIIINSNVLHYITAKGFVEYDCLIVDLSFLAQNELPVEKLEFDNVVRSETAGTIFKKVAAGYFSEDAYRMTAIRAEVLKLMVYLARNHSITVEEEAKRSFSVNDNVKLAIGYMRANFHRKITLEEVAAEVGLSKYYFAHEFKKATGKTFLSFLNSMRCQNAKKLLLQRKYSIHEVAQICGFENGSYFSRTFRSVMGCLPSEV